MTSSAPAMIEQRRTGAAVKIAVVLFIAIPLVLATTVAIRSGLFDFAAGAPSEAELKALWTLVGTGLGAAATTIAAVLTYSREQQRLAYESESTHRKDRLDEQMQHQKEIAERDASVRQRLETAVSGLGLISKDGHYAPRAVLAGALATLVQLGHPVLAMRILAAARTEDKDVIDHDTAAWLIGRVLTLTAQDDGDGDVDEAKGEAAALLLRFAPSLTDPEDCGSFSWPNAVTTRWPSGLSRNASVNVQLALVELMLNQSKTWWNDGATTHTWIVYTLDEVLATEGADSRPGQVAAALGRCIISVTDGERITGLRDARAKADVLARMSKVPEPQLAFLEKTRQRIVVWGACPERAQPGSAAALISPLAGDEPNFAVEPPSGTAAVNTTENDERVTTPSEV